ncbi:MAG TPA: hypothetical protein DCX12_00730 [Chloroflexi bacterium]|nr:hypothetical protein [Chloroflexota bacterium]HBV93673.1 hypothetical protein [Chloroflexota bacterium]
MPFQCSVRVCAAGVNDVPSVGGAMAPMYPTAQTSSWETPATAVSWSPPRLAALLGSGTGTIDQEVPFQRSARPCWIFPAGLVDPTAQTSLGEMALTPERSLLAAASPLGTSAAFNCQL